jgi:adenylate kinase
MPLYIVVLGPPGAGKGTQAQQVSKELKIPHISSGDIFRENFKNQTKLGKLANRYITRGELVPDDVTIEMIRERLSQEDCENGAILDGFPRTTAQAEALNDMLVEFGGKVDVVTYIKVPEKVLIERLSGRWICEAEGHVFHQKNSPPRKSGVCDFDGSELYQREDDLPETVKHRIDVYLEKTQNLIDYYQSKGILVEMDGTLPIEQISKQLLSSIKVVH